MSQNLTQPEEVDHVFMEMSGQDMKAGMPISDRARLNGDMHGFACDWSIGATDFSCGGAHKKSANGFSEPKA